MAQDLPAVLDQVKIRVQRCPQHPRCLGQQKSVQTWLFAGSHLFSPPLVLRHLVIQWTTSHLSGQAYSLRTGKKGPRRWAVGLASGDSSLSPRLLMLSCGVAGVRPGRPRAGCCPHYHLRGSPQPRTVETHIPISHRRKLRLVGPGALPSTVELGVQHRPSVPDSGAVSLHQGKWPGSHGPHGCRSTSWPLVGGQVSPNLGLAGSYLQGRLTAGRRLHKLLWLPAWGSALFPLPGNSRSPWGPPRCFPGGLGTLC